MSTSKVYSKIPRTGLGNMFLVWAKGYVFARKYQLPFVHSGFTIFLLGPWLRRERSKRFYFNYFYHQPALQRLQLMVDLLTLKKIEDPSIDTKPEPSSIYLFKKLYVSNDYFLELKPFRKELKHQIFDMIQDRLKRKLNALPAPEIGIHIRRGDFKLGSTITPLVFFISVIKSLRAATGKELKVTVFSDALDEELAELLTMNGVARSIGNEDIIDLLLLSKSKFLVLSIGSTFSYWAGFLTDGHVIKNEREWHPTLRPVEDNLIAFEGKWENTGQVPEALLVHIHNAPEYGLKSDPLFH